MGIIKYDKRQIMMDRMKWKIYIRVNCAETCRDADDIHEDILCYKTNLHEALYFANNYIKQNFARKEKTMELRKDGTYFAMDFCSWPIQLYIENMTKYRL